MAPIRFLLNGELREESSVPPTMTVLDWLRGVAHLTGTKEGCAEGDCGACTIGLIRTIGGRPRYLPVNSCLMMLPQLDGASVLTIEGVAPPDGPLHPVQQALVDTHATQCGFCTPGFVMAMLGLYFEPVPADDSTIHNALAGTLCRCTGYRPIVEAARRIAGGATQPPGRIEPTARTPTSGGEREYRYGDQVYLAPSSVEELVQVLVDHADAIVLGGGTDVGLLVSKERQSLPCVVSTTGIAGLEHIADEAEAVTFGGAATYADAQPLLDRYFPAFGDLVRRIGSRQIRNLGTLAGNIATASPIGDTLPCLMALEAAMTLRSVRGTRVLRVEQFVTGYRKTALEPDEIIEAIRIPKLAEDQQLFVSKLSKRFDQDISTVIAAFRVSGSGKEETELRAFYGGMAEKVARARHLEALLAGRVWTCDLLDEVESHLARDFRPMSDHRGSAAYRLRAAGNLVRRLFEEIGPRTSASRIEAL